MTSDTDAQAAKADDERSLADAAQRSAGPGLLVADSGGTVLWVDPKFKRIIGGGRAPTHAAGGLRVRQEIRDAIEAARASGRPACACLCGADGAAAITLDVTPHHDAAGALQFLSGVQRAADAIDARPAPSIAACRDALVQQAILSIADSQGRISFVNDNYCKISGFSREELIGRTHAVVQSGLHSDDFYDRLWRTIRNGQTWRGELRNRAKSGAFYWVDATIVPLLDADGAPANYVQISHDVTARKTTEEELRRAIRTDTLTDLDNRDVLLEKLRETLRPGGDTAPKGALLLIDMDHFRDINDSLGHLVGDKILRDIAERLPRRLREHDVVARLGGDEFAVVLRDAPTREVCETIVARLLNELSAPIKIAEHHAVVATFSIGVARFPNDAEDPVTLLQRADIAMYEAKRAGRAQSCFYEDDIEERAGHRQGFGAAIRAALPRNEFQVALQPQIDLQTGRHRGFESLARWTIDGQPVPPNRFISCAEESGLIVELGADLMRKAFAAHRRMRDSGLRPGVMAINVAAQQLRSDNFIPTLRRALSAFDMSAYEVEIELTETTIIGRVGDRLERALNEARDLGCTIALDDFGTGYSSLSHIHAFRPDIIKIDRSFVNDIETDPGAAQLVRATLALTREMNLRSVAEGVEREHQAALLRDYGCNYAQGYFFARPLTLEDALDYLNQSSSAA